MVKKKKETVTKMETETETETETVHHQILEIMVKMVRQIRVMIQGKPFISLKIPGTITYL